MHDSRLLKKKKTVVLKQYYTRVYKYYSLYRTFSICPTVYEELCKYYEINYMYTTHSTSM